MDIPAAWIGWGTGIAAAVAAVWGFVKNVLEIRTKLAGTRFGKWAVMFFTEGKRIAELERKVAALTPVVVPLEIETWSRALVSMRENRLECTRLLDLVPSKTVDEFWLWCHTAKRLTGEANKISTDESLPLHVATRFDEPQVRPSRATPEVISQVNPGDRRAAQDVFDALGRVEVALREVETALAQTIEDRRPKQP